jgi:hypothetical protein
MQALAIVLHEVSWPRVLFLSLSLASVVLLCVEVL